MNTISFSCPHCHAALTVPENLAGVSGPCPTCGNTIAAPKPPPLAQPRWEPPPVPPAPPEEDAFPWETTAVPAPSQPKPWEQPRQQPTTQSPHPSPRGDAAWEQPPAQHSDWNQFPKAPSARERPPVYTQEPQTQASPQPRANKSKLPLILGIPLALLLLAGTAYVVVKAMAVPPATNTIVVPSNVNLPKTNDPEPPAPATAPPINLPPSGQGGTLGTNPLNGEPGLPQPYPDPTPIPPPDTTIEVRPAEPEPEPAAPAAGAGTSSIDESDPGTKKVLDQLRTSKGVINAFLAAKDWKERSQYVLHGKELEPYLRIYYEQNPDGPTEAVEQPRQTVVSHTPDGKYEVQVYTVLLKGHEKPIPFCVETTPEGTYLIDWLSFAQFKDDLLEKFFENPTTPPKTLCFTMRRIPTVLTDAPDADNKLAYRLTDFDDRGKDKIAYVDKNTPIGKDMDAKYGFNEQQGYIVVGELAWNDSGPKPFVEIVRVSQDTWRTDEFLSKTLKLSQ